MKTFKSLILTAVLLFSGIQLFASHVAGGNISYKCTGIPNQFIITLTAFKDCSTNFTSQTEIIDLTNDCGIDSSIIATIQHTEEVSQICVANLPNTTCSGTGQYTGVEVEVYTAIITLPYLCDAWIFSWEKCNRNAVENLTSSTSTCFYIETKLYSSTQACNNSPTINSQPIPYVCAGQQATYNFGIQEQDGDSLTFEFIGALDDGGTPIGYDPPYSDSLPIPGITIDFNTGQITFNYTITGNFVVAVLIKEYNQCDELVGTMIHDIQFVIETCSNQVPQVVSTPSVITNFNNFGTAAQLIGDNQIKLCTGDQFCFDISFDDVDPNTSVILSSNVNAFLPGATFTTAPGNPATATICWTYTQGYTGSVISINASDDACPVPGFANYVVDLEIPYGLFSIGDSLVTICGTEDSINLFDYLTGTNQNNGQWYDPYGQITSNFQDANIMATGKYDYILFPGLSGSACGNSQSSCILLNDTAFVNIEIGDLSAPFIDSVLQDESIIGAGDGVASVGPITGNFEPFNVVWNAPNSGLHATQIVTSDSIVIQNSLYEYQLGALPWTVTISDSNNCDIVHDFFIYCNCGLGLDGDESTNLVSEIYPNPISDELFVTIHNFSNSLVIMDISGKNVLEYENILPGKFKIDLSNLHTGQYILSVTSFQNVEVHKLIKK